MLDAGDGARLERFGKRVVDRPAPSALAPRRDPAAWATADLRFDRDRGWTSPTGTPLPDEWTIELEGLRLRLRPTDAGQVGLFPEHLAMLPWLRDQAEGRRPAPAVLDLFAYTGVSTLLLARAGAHVAHVDSSRPAVTWARANAAASGLGDRPIRWLVEDAPRFVDREARRGRRYDGVVLDPPSYGHGGGGSAWRIERDLPPLVERLSALLAPDGFVLLTAHTDGITDADLAGLLTPLARSRGTVSHGDLDLTAASGAVLPLGVMACWDGSA